jgi:hypothetical protein
VSVSVLLGGFRVLIIFPRIRNLRKGSRRSPTTDVTGFIKKNYKKGKEKMKNLYEETMGILAVNGKTLDDIVAVQGEDFAISIDEFIELSKQLDYDSGYGSAHVATDLVIVGDGWWLERREYDGSEWWEFRAAPQPKPEIKSVRTLGDDADYWPKLAEYKN